MIQWKPLMALTEVEEYTRGRYYQGKDFYHGTSLESAQSIVTQCAKWRSGSENTYGDGFYLTRSPDVAKEYARQISNSTVLTARVKVSQPKIFRDSLDFYSFLDSIDAPFDESQAELIAQFLIRKGYDAIEIMGILSIVIILNHQQIVFFDLEVV
jgi:hypothetical protein